MIHLGICYGHNATVAVVQNGRLVFCQSEERLNRIKNSTGFPRRTLEYVYQNVCKREEVTSATLFEKTVYGYLHLKSHNFEPYQFGDYLSPEIRRSGLKQWIGSTELGWQLSKYWIAINERRRGLQDEARRYFCEELVLDESKVFYLDHHLSHAYSTVSSIQDWGRALIFTLDGVGDWTCATVNLFDNGNVTVLDRTDHRNSLGYYYAAVTALLGMKAGEHEFKVMGLAPYARHEYYSRLTEQLNAYLDVDELGRWTSRINPRILQSSLEKLFRYQRFDNIAGAIQQLTEHLILKWVLYWVRKINVRNVAVAGGVFMNVKACQRLTESSEIEKLFVMPSAADESTAIGCATWGSQRVEPQTRLVPLRELYLGMEFSDEYIERVIEQTGASGRYTISCVPDINQQVARLLTRNEIVARCSGRMEFGARALGNRSILANPSRLENLHRINDAIKSRDFWMPFTPSILEEDMARYIVNCDRIYAPYMCVTFDTTSEARRELVAAIHPRDFTARPQCVRKEWNPDYHEIIVTFKSLTGIGGVLNTSLNLHGEPNVCTPEDAIRTVDRSGLKYLVMGHYLFEKLI